MKRLLLTLVCLALFKLVAAQQAQTSQQPQPSQIGPSKAEVNTLKPRRIIVNGDTLYAYNRTQQNEIARLITVGKIDLETLEKREIQLQKVNNTVENLRNMIFLREGEIQVLQDKIQMRDNLLMKQQGLVSLQKAEMERKDKKLQKQSFQSKVLTFLGIALLIIVLIVLL